MSPDTMPSAFKELPVDVLIHVLSFLPASDLLSLRRVCRFLRAVTNERSVWINALRSYCKQHNVYGSSFPVAEMSNGELKSAATGCTRFNAHMRRVFALSPADNSEIAPLATRVLQNPLEPREEFDNLRFVPGGRFVLSSHQNLVRVWDAGTQGGTPVVGPIASYEIPAITRIRSVRTRASPVAQDEILVVVTSVLDHFAFRLHVFRFRPTACPPKLEPFCEDLVLPIFDDVPIFLGSTNRHIAVATNSRVLLWNIVKDTWVCWEQPHTHLEDAIYVCDNHIVTIRADSAEVYLSPMPSLKPRKDSDTAPFVNLPVTSTFQLHRIARPDEQLNTCVSGITLVFQGRETSPLFFDVMNEHDNGKVLLSHYVLERGKDQTLKLRALGESAIPARFAHSHTLHLEWLGCRISEGRPCVQSYVVEGSKLHVCLADIDLAVAEGKDKSVLPRYTLGTLETPNLLVNEVNIDFCSFSARICARVPGERQGQYKVNVMEYVGLKESADVAHKVTKL
ncbi:F-box domain-containing protein [Mycena indigotica]|uniref:F-box domain-containing protein n=1 Tax=Mycena indigotica TaxID=2126181 RepID=A0A8H6TCT8_9AGAR|nr:F-box domain-containing protein [Mycena indigotica]KAF7316460.1 F-box domain-containing protein [Mycena indigotica]